MERVRLGEVELAYEVVGSGEPVVLVHGGLIASFFAPLLGEPALTERFQLINYHRIGYGESSRAPGPVDLADQAEQTRGLLAHLGIDRAHVVGHSSGGLIALQLALQAPSLVASLALLEPSLPVPSSAVLAERTIMPMFQRYQNGDKAGTVDAFLAGVCGQDYRASIDRGLPEGAFDQAVQDVDTFITVEAPSVGPWSFSQAEATRITAPVLAIVGERSGEVTAVAVEAHALLKEWFPEAESYVLPRATHLLQVENPSDLAITLADFAARHVDKSHFL
ncbi:alpha/beta fold hydrolase [Tenggerimyces flavus]|uniref:Alpha/beta fold hydrolase n=1 Tax=Tenggerimyces flavus TaxID=1708749 RepID=A0ABV7YEA9_9ACTN|nr:alpha/beta hydrolase [Tenggerimyces flavus]MBM7787996.1 pimeloyl-ACP methyl ester carboxylesterase [Tenggerimyces flavus]